MRLIFGVCEASACWWQISGAERAKVRRVLVMAPWPQKDTIASVLVFSVILVVSFWVAAMGRVYSAPASDVGEQTKATNCRTQTTETILCALKSRRPRNYAQPAASADLGRGMMHRSYLFVLVNIDFGAAPIRHCVSDQRGFRCMECGERRCQHAVISYPAERTEIDWP